MAQINLAPGSQYVLAVRRRRRLLYGLTALVLALMVGTGILLHFLVAAADTAAATLRTDLQSVETQIASASEEVKKIKLFESRLQNLDTLLANHRVWSLYLQELERLLPPDTVLTGLAGSYDGNTLELTGTASNMDAIAVALATLQNQPANHPTLFKSGTVSNVVQLTQTGPAGEIIGQRYSFKMTLAF